MNKTESPKNDNNNPANPFLNSLDLCYDLFSASEIQQQHFRLIRLRERSTFPCRSAGQEVNNVNKRWRSSPCWEIPPRSLTGVFTQPHIRMKRASDWVGGSIPALGDVPLSKTLNPELLPVALRCECDRIISLFG